MFSKQKEFAPEVERFLSAHEEGHAKQISGPAESPSGFSGQGIAREAQNRVGFVRVDSRLDRGVVIHHPHCFVDAG